MQVLVGWGEGVLREVGTAREASERTAAPRHASTGFRPSSAVLVASPRDKSGAIIVKDIESLARRPATVREREPAPSLLFPAGRQQSSRWGV